METKKPKAKHTGQEDVKKMTQIVDALLKEHGLTVRKHSVGANGRAFSDKSLIIPYPTNVEKFCVCLHEIGHHAARAMSGAVWKKEYKAEQYALTIAKQHGFDVSDYEVRAKRYVLLNIAKGLARNLNLDKVDAVVKEFVSSEVNIEEWKGKKVLFYEWGKRSHLPINPSFY